MEFKYQKYTSEYKEQVIELMKYLWDFDKKFWKPYFEWKFENNPYTEEPLAFIALDGEKVIAFRGYMVLPFQIENRSYLCAVLADTVTHKDYQRKGLFSGVTQYSINEIQKDDRFLISLNSSSGGKTLNGYLKLGWKPFCEREHLFRFTWRGIANKIAAKKNNICNCKTLGSKKNLIITDVCKAKDIVSMPFDYKELSHKREEKLYAWRFLNPKETYKFAYSYDENGMLVSYLILYKIANDKWDLIDFNTTNDDDLKKLLNWVCKCFQPFYILLWTVSKTNIIYLSRHKFGFTPLNILLRQIKKFQKPPFLIREFNQAEHVIMSDKMKWNLYKFVADEI